MHSYGSMPTCSISSLRYCFVAALALLVTPSFVQAGIIVGDLGSGPPATNDNEANVLTVIGTYNAGPSPDLPTDIDLFGKTDDVGFPYDGSNGLLFWADLAMTDPVTDEDELKSLTTAYFTSTVPGLYYYSVKGGNKGFRLYTVMPGKNILQNPGNTSGNEATISHVSFWTVPVPEPTGAVLWLLGTAGLALWRRR